MEHAQGMDVDGRMKDMVEGPVPRASFRGRLGKQARREAACDITSGTSTTCTCLFLWQPPTFGLCGLMHAKHEPHILFLST
jgi:hypothetical protein